MIQESEDLPGAPVPVALDNGPVVGPPWTGAA